MLKFIIIFISFAILNSSFAKEPRICGYKDWEALYNNDFSYIKVYEKDPCIFIPKNRFNLNHKPAYVVERVSRYAQGDYLKIILISSNGENITPISPQHIIYLKHPNITMEEAEKIGITDYHYIDHKFVLTNTARMTIDDKFLYDSIQDVIFVLEDVTGLEVNLKN